MVEVRKKIALVLGSLPSVEEIDQFRLITDNYDVQVISSESVCGYLTQNSYFQDLTCIALKDHDENPSFLPGLEKVLTHSDIVIVKERLGLYAYQAVKAKWRHRFQMVVWVDNLVPFPAHDMDQMRTIRNEITQAADGFIVQSKAARLALEIEGVASERIHDMLPWLEARCDRSPEGRDLARERLGIALGDFVIAFLGQIEWEEGINDLASAAKLMTMREPSLKQKMRLVFCGVGSYSGELRERFIAMGIDNMALYYAPTRDAIRAIQEACNAIYISPLASLDRVDGDPYRIVGSMIQGIPIIAARHATVEEFCGKHRVDFCAGSPLSLAKAIQKVRSSAALVEDIVQKNLAEASRRLSRDRVIGSMKSIIAGFVGVQIADDHNSLDHRVLEIEAKIRSKQYIEAVDLIEAVFRMDNVPVHHRANLYRLIGDCFAKLGDIDAAKDAYLQAAELDPYMAKVYIGLGTVGLMKNSHDIAVLHFQKAVNLSPDDEMANLGLGLAFQGMNEHKEAARWIIKALSINPENTAALFSLVRSAHEGNLYEEADKAIRRYLAIHPNDYNFIYTLGGIQYKIGNFQDCLKLMNQILTADPKDKRAAALAKQAKSELEQKSKATSSNA
jgi:Flp pilus assembly protein TadD